MPRARLDDIVVSELPDEMLVYDLKTDQAHCVNAVAASIWKVCDGRTPVSSIAQALAVDEDVVWLGLRKLEKAELLAEPVRWSSLGRKITRRDAMRRLGLSAAALPLVWSIIAPTAADAASICGATGCIKLAQIGDCGTYATFVGTCWLTNGQTKCADTNTDQRTCTACRTLISNHSWCM